jgi:hypothetical protein
MAEPSWPIHVELDAYVTDVQTAQVKFRVPVPIVLVTAQVMRDVPRRVGLASASELIAALIMRASDEEHLMADMIGDYREKLVYEVLSIDDRIQGPFTLPERPPLS